MPKPASGHAARVGLAIFAATALLSAAPAGASWLDDEPPPWSATVRPSIWRDGPTHESTQHLLAPSAPAEPSGRPGGLSGPALAISLGVAAATVAAFTFALEPPRNSRWQDSNSFDRELTDGLGGSSRNRRDAAAIASDVLLGTISVAMVADWYWLREEYGFWDSAGNDGLFLLGSLATTQLLKGTTGRERPLADRCDRRGSFAASCDGLGRDANASFNSGHASISGTMAGLICARHLRRASVGGKDWAACGAAATTSLATGMLRITAYEHWGTDVLAGWASGVAFGYFLPTRFRYHAQRPVDFAVAPSLAPGFVGLNLSISF